MSLLSALQLTPLQWFTAVCCAMMIGFSKTAVNGVTTLAIPIMAGLFGGKASAAIILPMLITGDLLAVRHYRKHANWSHIRSLLPWTLGGIIIGLTVGNLVNDGQFKLIIAVSVLVCLGMILWLERHPNREQVPTQWWFAALVGMAGGFTTMIGNAAGPVMTVYFLAMRLDKYHFISTGAWLFMILNLIKLPLQLLFWKAITPTTLTFDLVMIPAIIGGAVLGIHVIKYLPEKPFRYTVMALTFVAALKLFF